MRGSLYFVICRYYPYRSRLLPGTVTILGLTSWLWSKHVSQRAHGAIITPLLRQNDVAALTCYCAVGPLGYIDDYIPWIHKNWSCKQNKKVHPNWVNIFMVDIVLNTTNIHNYSDFTWTPWCLNVLNLLVLEPEYFERIAMSQYQGCWCPGQGVARWRRISGSLSSTRKGINHPRHFSIEK